MHNRRHVSFGCSFWSSCDCFSFCVHTLSCLFLSIDKILSSVVYCRQAFCFVSLYDFKNHVVSWVIIYHISYIYYLHIIFIFYHKNSDFWIQSCKYIQYLSLEHIRITPTHQLTPLLVGFVLLVL